MKPTKRPRIYPLLVLLSALFLCPLSTHAEVYMVLGQEIASLTELLGLAVKPGGKRRIVLNGQPLTAELSETEETPEQLLRKLTEARLAKLRALDTPVPMEELHHPLWLRGPNWHVLSAADLTGTLPDSAAPDRLVIMLPTPHPPRQTVWTLEFRELGGFQRLVRASNADEVPGPVLRDIHAPPGSRRIFSLSQHSEAGISHILGFEGNGVLLDTVDHYRRVLGRDAPVTTLADNPGAVILHARLGNLRVNVQVSIQPGGNVLSLVQVQRGRGGHS